jgi:hypothetical protein
MYIELAVPAVQGRRVKLYLWYPTMNTVLCA